MARLVSPPAPRPAAVASPPTPPPESPAVASVGETSEPAEALGSPPALPLASGGGSCRRARQPKSRPSHTSPSRARRPALARTRVGAARALEDAPMPPTFWESVLLGAIQGVCGLLPISSSGHLALADVLFDVSSRAATLEVLLRLGTVLAVLVVLRLPVKAALADGFAAVRQPALFSTTPGARDALVMLLAALPSALASFALRDVVERWSHAPLALGLGFLATAAMLLGAHFAKPGSEEQPGVVGALLMGAAQGVAVLPGLSPLAATLLVALLFGVRRQRAFELALLVWLPVALGQLLALALGAPRAPVVPGLVGPAAVACVMAFLTGVPALWLLRRSVAAGRLPWFAAWLVPVSLATLALAKAWPHG